MANHVHRVRIYYEDTDLSGAVYHANYLRYFERAREHLFGPERLVSLWNDDGLGFVVYKAQLTWRAPSHLGDELEIRSSWRKDGRFRAIFDQAAWRAGEERALVEGAIELACVDREGKLTPLPELPA
jgi:acyl-CoA thioester hydrolase